MTVKREEVTNDYVVNVMLLMNCDITLVFTVSSLYK